MVSVTPNVNFLVQTLVSINNLNLDLLNVEVWQSQAKFKVGQKKIKKRIREKDFS